jgi:prepilin-type processing-associated H-X9-DG protein
LRARSSLESKDTIVKLSILKEPVMARLCRRTFVWVAFFLLVGLVPPLGAAGQVSPVDKLMTVLPDEVLGFAATAGGEHLKGQFEKSTLGRIWYDPEVQSFCQSIKEAVVAKIQQEAHDPNVAGAPQTILNLVDLVTDRPLIVGATRKQSPQGPGVYGFAILDAGERKAQIASDLAKLEALAGKGEIVEITVGSLKMRGPKDAEDLPVYWGWVGNYLVFAANENEGLAVKYLSKPRPAVPDYLSTVSGGGELLVAYAGYEKIFALITEAVEQEGSEADRDSVTAVLTELGLNKVGARAARAGFAGPDVVCESFLAVPAPQTGLFAALRPVDLGVFDMAGAGAVSCAAVNCDLAGMYDTVMGAIKAAAPAEAYAEIQEGITEFELQTDLSIREGLLESLAGPMVSYSLAAGVVMEAPGGGTVAIARLKDTPKLEKQMLALEGFAAAKSNGMLQVSSQVQSDGRTYHSWVIAPLAMMQVMPCWTTVNDHIVIATNPSLCSLAVKQIVSSDAANKSIRTTEGFKEVTTKLPTEPIFLCYTDSQVQFNQMMIKLQQFWPMIGMVAAQAGVDVPVMLPSLTHISKDMGPSCQYAWFDSDGLHSRYRGLGIEASMARVAGASMGMGILMPALARARELAQRVVSATNLSGIGKACIVYANDDPEGRYPPDLETLVVKDYIPAKTLESKLKPKGFEGPSYIYIAGQTAATHPGNIVAYENPAYCHEGVNVLFVDCHVQWMKPEQFMAELEATYQRLGREMPQIKFKEPGTGGLLEKNGESVPISPER